MTSAHHQLIHCNLSGQASFAKYLRYEEKRWTPQGRSIYIYTLSFYIYIILTSPHLLIGNEQKRARRWEWKIWTAWLAEIWARRRWTRCPKSCWSSYSFDTFATSKPNLNPKQLLRRGVVLSHVRRVSLSWLVVSCLPERGSAGFGILQNRDLFLLWWSCYVQLRCSARS